MSKSSTGKHRKKVAPEGRRNEPLILPELSQGECFAYIERAVGSGRFVVKLVNESGAFAKDDEMLVATLRGRMKIRKAQNRVQPGDFVLAAHRGLSINNREGIDILLKYSEAVVRQLQVMRYIPNVTSSIVSSNIEAHGSNTLDDILSFDENGIGQQTISSTVSTENVLPSSSCSGGDMTDAKFNWEDL